MAHIQKTRIPAQTRHEIVAVMGMLVEIEALLASEGWLSQSMEIRAISDELGSRLDDDDRNALSILIHHRRLLIIEKIGSVSRMLRYIATELLNISEFEMCQKLDNFNDRWDAIFNEYQKSFGAVLQQRYM